MNPTKSEILEGLSMDSDDLLHWITEADAFELQEAAPNLRAYITHSDPDIRIAAADALGTLRDKASGKIMLETLEYETQPEVIDTLIYNLGQVDYRKAVPLIVTLLTHEDENVQRMAAAALGNMGSRVLPELYMLNSTRGTFEVRVHHVIKELVARRTSSNLQTYQAIEESCVVILGEPSRGGQSFEPMKKPVASYLPDPTWALEAS